MALIAAALCEVHFPPKWAVATNKVWVSGEAVPGADRRVGVCVMALLLWELMKF